jgi:hypothetical protein
VVSVMPRPYFTPGKGPRYPLYRWLGGPQSRSGHRGYSKNLLVDESGIIRTQMGSTIDQNMVAGHGTLCTIPPRNSNLSVFYLIKMYKIILGRSSAIPERLEKAVAAELYG